DTLIRNNIRLLAIGDVDRLLPDVRERLMETINLTEGAGGLNLIVAMSYSSRWEITKAVRRISEDICSNKLDPGTIDQQVFENYLSTHGVPDPDLLIRTSGELRLSNFLLWQLAYTELYFTDILWPDFGKEDFYNAIVDYQKRERRFGRLT
ncbi:MAG TPA: polyprenyl diphosphate synthase, partial [Bacteroidales bacterium]|nr:polyprenyl diphosphate synthase [Bacteroidales bacterium]